MKRITVAYPFEDVRGKLAGKQVLEYAENNNPAFEAPAGRQYARNYKACMIACKRSATGKTYFQIKTKTATKINAGSKLRMALLGGTGACRAAILTNSTYRAAVENVYAAAKAQGTTSAKTLEKYVYDVIYSALHAKSIMISFTATGTQSLIIQNPWVYTNQAGGQAINIKTDILVKFWPELAKNPVIFSVSGLKGVAHAGDTFGNVIVSNYNVLGMTKVAFEDYGDVAKIGDLFVVEVQGQLNVAQLMSDEVDGNIPYELSDTATIPE